MRVRRASSTWADQASVQADGHAHYFERHGFTVIPALLTAAEVESCSAELDRIAERREQLPNVRVIGTRNPLAPSYDLEDRRTSHNEEALRKLTGFAQISPVLAHCLVEHPTLLDVLHLLLGERVELYRDAIMFKSAEVGQEKPWHQDAVYWPFRPMALVSAMVAIDRSTPENGCLQVVPGSHRHVVDHEKINWELQVDPARCEEGAVYVPLEPGDCLVFHSLILHASEHNHSPANRRVSITSYSPGGLQILDPNIDPPVLLSDRAGR
ncbi:phytanoyl-CoA dioxygenase family protein [Dactylosporangium vinaceum]|uniref:Phytanoyl-CoA dioxygenase family protein n=2 Tax=Dactylosporangium vinaceum TaxID=53362 RepID=A0ABV5MD52_9ACTN